MDKRRIDKVYGVDINENYLTVCQDRYPALSGILELIHADLTKNAGTLPYADLLVANLFVEYVGYECFQKAVKQVAPQYVSCIIQVNTDESFVSDSPYIHTFDRLEEVLHHTEEHSLAGAMREIGYIKEAADRRALPNGKKLVRIDFRRLETPEG